MAVPYSITIKMGNSKSESFLYYHCFKFSEQKIVDYLSLHATFLSDVVCCPATCMFFSTVLVPVNDDGRSVFYKIGILLLGLCGSHNSFLEVERWGGLSRLNPNLKLDSCSNQVTSKLLPISTASCLRIYALLLLVGAPKSTY